MYRGFETVKTPEKNSKNQLTIIYVVYVQWYLLYNMFCTNRLAKAPFNSEASRVGVTGTRSTLPNQQIYSYW